MFDRSTILSMSFQLSKSIPLTELSIVRVAKELGVTPPLIHYYLGGRDALTSGVINAFYREAVESWPKLSGDWHHDLEVVAHHIYRVHMRYPGIAAYMVSHNRHRLFQELGEDETDYGIQFFEKYISAVRAIGFDPMRTATFGHLLIDFVVGNAHATVRHRWPGEHADFLNNRLAALDPQEFPSTHYVRESLIRLNASEAFAAGLKLVMQSLELERSKQ